MVPTNGYGWFHHPKSSDLKENRDGLPVFKDKRPITHITKTYNFLRNRTKEENTRILYSGPTEKAVTAGSVNIDIPFDLLSKTAIFPETSLDRQIAANLRLKRIIDEYLSLKERNAQVLKGLGIPYLEKYDDPEKNQPDSMPETIKAEKEARKTMENVLVFSEHFRTAPINQQAVVFQVAGLPKKDRQKITPAGNISGSRPSPGYPEKSSYQTAYGSNTELPWFFSFALKLIRYAVHNKLEILLWTAVMVMSGLIGLLVVKR
ncbi:hypothetical protein [Desulfobacter latus]|uniref:Uncharacterized protein n=1 Tax=Desulfobacter latus TaxID=2292 RepID=A0A850T1T8_9BACT|nr:hypothetical protein [Desulfobacter latus]NWH05061.1 hypothetical protein [Desulfobacter latus]